jgi:hypothetical protein
MVTLSVAEIVLCDDAACFYFPIADYALRAGAPARSA